MSGAAAVRADVAPDGDGGFDAATEPLLRIAVPIAKAVNYVALGDSYSAGEQGRHDAAGFEGSYRGESEDPELANPNAAVCRRWSEAYPQVFADRVLGNPDYGVTVTFDTFACTGAKTQNIHEPTDPEGLSVLDRHNKTNTPSPHTLIRDIERDEHGEVTSLTVPTHWEPRQAISLKQANAAHPVDMVTVTIGGNDVDFASIVQDCATPLVGCGGEVSAVLSGVQDLVTVTLRQVRTVAPDASVFVMGYSPLTPRPTPCPAGRRDCPELGLNRYIDECLALSAAGIVEQSADRGLISDIAIFGFGRFRVSLNDLADVIALSFSGSLKIDHVEAQYLWAGAAGLNAALREAAAAAGAHYVDTTGGVILADVPRGFVGHDPCSTNPWLHGFVVDADEFPVARSGKSFHPTPAGHSGYSRLLEQYIRDQYAAGTGLTEAGLPVNPQPQL